MSINTHIRLNESGMLEVSKCWHAEVRQTLSCPKKKPHENWLWLIGTIMLDTLLFCFFNGGHLIESNAAKNKQTNECRF